MRRGTLALLSALVLAALPMSVQAYSVAWELGGFGELSNGDIVTTRTVWVQGQASLPNYTPPGALVVLVGGVGDTLYGSVESELDGSFIVEAELPEGIARLGVYAVDPTNPEAFVLSSVELNPSAVLATNPLKSMRQQYTATDVLTDVEVNAQSTAEVLVLSASGSFDRSVNALSPEEQAAAARVAQMLDSTTMRMCSVGPTAEVMEVLRKVVLREKNEQRATPPWVRTKFDEFAARPGSLLERLKAGQEYITITINSTNQVTLADIKGPETATIPVFMLLDGVGHLSSYSKNRNNKCVKEFLSTQTFRERMRIMREGKNWAVATDCASSALSFTSISNVLGSPPRGQKRADAYAQVHLIPMHSRELPESCFSALESKFTTEEGQPA